MLKELCQKGEIKDKVLFCMEEDVLRVAAPDLVVAVLVDEGSGARGVTRHHVEARLRQAIERLLQVGELEVETGRVLLGWPIRVAALIERVTKDLLC